MSDQPEFEPKKGVLPYNLNTSPEEMTPAEFAIYRQRHTGRPVMVYKDDHSAEVSQYHRSGCDDARCKGCNPAGVWDYRAPDVEPDGPGTRLATTMAQLQQRLISNIRGGRVGWKPDDHTAILLAAEQAFADSLAESKKTTPDELTDADIGTAKYIARGFINTVLRQVRSRRSGRQR